jgi:hypothetical protein
MSENPLISHRNYVYDITLLFTCQYRRGGLGLAYSHINTHQLGVVIWQYKQDYVLQRGFIVKTLYVILDLLCHIVDLLWSKPVEYICLGCWYSIEANHKTACR